MTIKHGGPAFPTEYFYDHETKIEIFPSSGMTLRDYFAAKAVQGTLANSAYHDDSPPAIAKWAYEMADAMLKAREASGKLEA